MKRYFTGKLCQNGHIAERSVATQNCVECRRTTSARAYKKLTPEKLAAAKAAAVAFSKTESGKCIRRETSRRYHARQGGYLPAPKERHCPPKPSRCELCNSETLLNLDHDHKTGAFRGWLCYRCNGTLGNVESVGLDKIGVYLTCK